MWNSASPDGPVESTSAPDSSTIVIKLKDPVAYMVNWFASFGSFTGQILMVPKETDDTFDIRQGMIGTGPFYLKDHQPSVSFTLARNEEYWDKDFVLVDGKELPIVPESSARLAQFKAGKIHYYTGASAEDDLTVVKDQPKIQLFESDLATDSSVYTFGWKPVGDNKFVDERVRQAFSMACDRDLWIDFRYNVENFKKEGIPVRTTWNSHLAARDPFVGGGWFLDPQKPEFGPNAKYFQYNLPEAKKLLIAAGYPDGFDMTFSYPNAPQFSVASRVEPVQFFFQELGINVIQNGFTDYTQGYIPLDRDASGEFEGIGYHSITGGIPATVSPTSAMVAEHLPTSGVTFHGYDVGGKGDKSGDPDLIAILSKARVEKDVEARKKLIREAQQYLGKAFHSLTRLRRRHWLRACLAGRPELPRLARRFGLGALPAVAENGRAAVRLRRSTGTGGAFVVS